MQAADIETDYNNSDPGPKHSCAAGGLAASTFDSDTTQNGANASFELLPGCELHLGLTERHGYRPDELEQLNQCPDDQRQARV